MYSCMDLVLNWLSQNDTFQGAKEVKKGFPDSEKSKNL